MSEDAIVPRTECSNCGRKLKEGLPSPLCGRCRSRDTLQSAHEIAGEYAGNLTVRQLYYQLVARGFILNSFESYQRLVRILTDARLAGSFPFEWLLDRTREARAGKFTTMQSTVSSALRDAADDVRKAPESWLWCHRWYGQPVHVSVWVEKEALAGVFEDPCDELGVSWFVLRGYSSLSALSQWVDNTSEAYQTGNVEEAVVLYFGDHDPDGLEIPRSAERNVLAIAEVRGIDLPPLRFERIALTREQIRQYNPPPFPAKESSSRFDAYVAETGLRTAWELDALRPEVLAALIRESVDEYFDYTIYEENEDTIRERRKEMRAEMMKPTWIRGALEG
jgi:hypothetical protein